MISGADVGEMVGISIGATVGGGVGAGVGWEEDGEGVAAAARVGVAGAHPQISNMNSVARAH